MNTIHFFLQDLLLVQLIFALLNFVEANHDFYVIKLQDPSNPKFAEFRAQWKKWSAVYYLVVMAIYMIISVYSVKYWLLVLLPLNRVIFFEMPLNVRLYGWKNIFYLDDSSKTNHAIWKVMNFIRRIKFLNDIIGKWEPGKFKFIVSILLVLVLNVILKWI